MANLFVKPTTACLLNFRLALARRVQLGFCLLSTGTIRRFRQGWILALSAIAISSVLMLGCGAGAPQAHPKTASAAASDTATPDPSVAAANDHIAPSIPQKLASTDVSFDQFSVEWQASTDNVGVAGYELYLDGVLVSETEETQFLLTQLTAGASYTVKVRAIDDAQNTSAFTPEIVVRTGSADRANNLSTRAIDTQAPTAPANLRAVSIGSNQVTLAWAPSTDNVAVTAYEILQQQQVVATTTRSPAQITGLRPQTRYSFQVRALDALSNTSVASAAVPVTTRAAITPSVTIRAGIDTYIAQCVSCHGANGLGVGGLTRSLTVAALTAIIDQTMPPADPTLCVGTCAAEVAQYVFDNFTNKSETPQTDPLAALPRGAQQIANVCARAVVENRDDAVRRLFCAPNPPQITSLAQLQAGLGLAFTNPTAVGRRGNGTGGNPAFALTGNSSSLVARSVNALNPRAIIFTPSAGRGAGGAAPPGFVAMGFVRGDRFAELAVADQVTNDVEFYLVRFTLACEATNTCTPGDTLTPAVESNWTSVTVYDDTDLSNTTLDCLQCHQTGGPTATKILRMQELTNPWDHWFRSNTASNVLIADFRAAHGNTETYAGIPGNLIAGSDPRLLENLVRASGSRQVNQFNSRAIQAEVQRSSPAQPADNTVPGVSATWDGIYANAVSGQAIGVPYHDTKVTDPLSLAGLIQSYQGLRSGVLAASALPDLRAAFYTAQLRDIGFKVKAGLDGPGIVRQACTQCHNSRLDQTLSRARFNVDLAALSNQSGGVLTGADRDAEIGLAINRLQLPADDVRKMPPELFRTLDPAEIDLVIGYLCRQTGSPISQCAGR